MSEGTTLYCGDNCNHTGPHRYPPKQGSNEWTAPTPREACTHYCTTCGKTRFGGEWMHKDCEPCPLHALTRREPIDVERLARAFYNVTQGRFAISPYAPILPDWRDPSVAADVWDKAVQDGAEIAAEYDRLGDADKL